METIIDILLIGAMLGWIARLAQLEGRWLLWGIPLLLAAVLLLLQPVALRQNNQFLGSMLKNERSKEMLLAVFWIAVLGQLFVAGKSIQSELEGRKISPFWQFWQKVLLLWPGVIVLAGLFYLEINFYLLDWNLDFMLLAVTFCVLVLVLPPLLAILLRFLVGPSRLMEFHFLMLLWQLIATMALSAMIINTN